MYVQILKTNMHVFWATGYLSSHFPLVVQLLAFNTIAFF